MTDLEPQRVDATARTVSLDLGEGAVVLVRPTVIDEADLQQVSWTDRVDAEVFFASIRRLATLLIDALSAAAPTRITAEFGIQAGVKAGKLTALLVEGQGEATITVTLEWDRAKAS
jgi:hypothetical protein